MKRSFHSPWLVALAVLALAALPVLAALAAHREQARRAEALLFERSADLVAAHLRLQTSRQMGWQNALRMRLSNRPDAPEKMLDETFASGAWPVLPENCGALGYGALDNGRIVLRWRQVRSGATIAEMGEDLLQRRETAALLRDAMAKSMQIVSEQRGMQLLSAMMVAESSLRQPRGWLIVWWNLGAMCSDPQLRFVTSDHTLTARPLEGVPLPGERVEEIGEGGAHWQVAMGKGTGFAALFPHVSERALAWIGGGCAVLLALLAGFATRTAGLRTALATLRADPATAALPFIFLTARGEAPDIRAGMKLGADDYLPKPVARTDLLDAIRSRLQRASQQRTFAPCFDSPTPLESLGLSPREAEVLLWMAQGKGNADIAIIIGCSTATVKKHTIHIFTKLGVEGRPAAILCALETLSTGAA